ncbi:MAG TPA: glycoside hydrolase family 38 C-terminal domain-containing protein, partial [Candidatus Baltobacteraceae bacterium]|nr:glycoside hydrolase family 38 C-terminal domain-containing protein [Candidatus Baltobacteraceae bacterium]
MEIRLEENGRDGAIAMLQAALPPQTHFLAVEYHTRTGALLRVDGEIAGAYDREHHDVVLPPSSQPRELTLEVELQSLPTSGLPAGRGIIWWYLQARSREHPAQTIAVRAVSPENGRERTGDLPVIGHSHLDVAWLWTYEQTRRKAARMFAIACDLLDRDPAFRFVQSQPQLYRFVQEAGGSLIERVEAYIEQGRFDPDVAALWVESDCNIPSGESLLRQMLFAYEFCTQHFDRVPQIAWLPDSFGFMNTLPQLLAHAGIPYFATTKLQWNDTTKFPYPQFVWEGPDGSSVIAALIQSYDGGPYPWRILRAKERNEPLVVGYGDGGGGVTAKMLRQVPHFGRWIRLRDWFDGVRATRTSLPVHKDELYLEYHRGVYTTHHDVKMHNALLERSLNEAEELLAWCLAVHAPRASVAELHTLLRHAWEITLRNQFHDVLPGTSIEAVYGDVREEYAQAEAAVARVISATQSILPRERRPSAGPQRIEPIAAGGVFTFDNGLVHAKIHRTGIIVDLAVKGRRNVCTRGNVLRLYRDVPKAWEAWNIDRQSLQLGREATACGARVQDGALILDYRFGESPGVMRVTLFSGEPFLRMELDVQWAERRTLLRMENEVPLSAPQASYGAPHGIIRRSTGEESAAERAKYEVPGQRFAAIENSSGDGLAIFALDTYGWNARTTSQGFITLGHSLLRGTTWPDEHADLGAHQIQYAFAPFHKAAPSMLEHAWQRFAHEPRVRLFTADTDAVVIVACKPAHDGDGIVVRVRECDGEPQRVGLRCAARMTHVQPADGLERPLGEPLPIEGEAVQF